MIKWCEIGDLHLNEHETTGVYDKDRGLNTRFMYKAVQLEMICEKIAKDKEIDFVVFMGDVYNSINPPDILRASFNSCIKHLLKANKKIFIIVGNHETTGAQWHAFGADRELSKGFESDNLIIIDEAYQMKMKDKSFLFIPFGKTKHLKKLDNNNKKDYVVFGHFTVEGADFGNRKAKNLGVNVPLKEIRKYKYVSLGHIHKPQKYYVGSLFRNTFGERDYKCVYKICEWDDKEVWEKDYESDNIEMHQIEINEENYDSDIKKLKGIVKIRYSGSREWLKTLNLVKERKKILSSFEHDIFSLKLEKKIIDIGDNVEVKAGGKKLEFGEVIRQLSSDDRLIKYVEDTVERL